MASYLVLATSTQKGIEEIKERPKRADRLRNRCKQHGCEVKAAYLAMGRYDGAWLVEAPDDAAMAKVIIGAGMTGVVRTETLRLFDEGESNAIIADV